MSVFGESTVYCNILYYYIFGNIFGGSGGDMKSCPMFYNTNINFAQFIYSGYNCTLFILAIYL